VRFASVCSGIEAASVAWSPLGWKPVFFSEIDKFPCAVLAHHYRDVPNLGDMTGFKDWPDADFDVLVGGTPCQSFSVAGLRKGLADPRGNLALVYLAIAARYRPRWLVWENVPGVLSSEGGRDFGSFLGGLGELGYGWTYRVLDAQYVRVDGLERAVPQRRRRVFVVGCLGDWRRAAAVLFEPESMSGHPSPRREARETTTRPASYGISPDCLDRTGEPTSGLAADRSGLGVAEEVSYSLRAKRPSGVAHAIAPIIAARTRAGGGLGTDFDCDGGLIAFDARQSDVIQYGNKTGQLDTDGRTVAFAIQERAVCENPDAGPDGVGVRDDGAAYTLEARTVPQAVAFAQNSRDELGESDVMQSLKVGGGKPGQSYPAIRQGWAVRRLTPLECERLMGFPDGYTAIPYRGKPTADGPRYKALGNSMAVNVVRWIGQRIDLVETALQSDRAAA
jgi:DNA (cytosine-5)-methyltransferase 1